MTRQESVGLALTALSLESQAVLVHDAARPLVQSDLIKRVLAALTDTAAAVPGLPISDTIKRASGKPPTISATMDRRDLYTVQTPQGMQRAIAEAAYRKLAADAFEGTDDVSLIEHFHLGEVRLVEGDPRNIKVTTMNDLRRVQELLALPQRT